MNMHDELPQVSHPLPWQIQEWEFLTAQLVENRLPHALLLTGREHIGKSQIALALTRLLLCSQPNELLNCGKCHACELSARGNHGDLRWVEPAENTRMIKIDQIRDALHFAAVKAGFGARKVIVISPADGMNINAYNALLKLLEEPGDDTHLILVSNNVRNVPATIRSRCHIVRMRTPSTESCINWLDSFIAEPAQSKSLLGIAGGLPLLAKQLYLSDASNTYLVKRHALESLLAGSISVQEIAQLWSDDSLILFLDSLVVSLESKVRATPATRLKLSKSKNIFGLLDEIHQLKKANASGANPNKQLLLMGLLSKCQRQLGVNSPDDKISSHPGGVAI